MDGDPEQVAGAILGDLRYPDGFRRRALNIVLLYADARSKGEDQAPATLARVAESLGELQSYAALRPLEKLYEHEAPRVRKAAVRALRYLHFKRSFGLIGRGLVDSDAGVREAAAEALKSLHFPHAFHPLQRIYREHPDEKVKTVALESIGKIGSIEAGELLLGVLRHESGTLQDVARKALATFDNADVIPILRQHAEVEAHPEVKKALEELLQRARRRG
jgi:HEAT repeat protein